MKNEFDKNLTDKGWQSMRPLLDREMPEQRRRRRFAWWLFALLLLPLAGVGGWWLFGKSKTEKATPPAEKPAVAEPIVEAKTTPTHSESGFLPNVASLPAVVGVPANRHSDRVIPNEVKNLKKSLLPAVIDGSANNGKDLNIKPLQIPPADISASPLYDTYVNPFEEFGNSPALKNVEPLPAIPQFVENESKTAINLSKIAIASPAPLKRYVEPQKWSLGLSAGLMTEKFNALDGFSTGLALDWQPIRRWGLRAGAQYAQYNLSDKKQPILAVASLDYVEATGNFNVLNDDTTGVTTPSQDASNKNVLVPVERLRRLEMPVMAFWQPTRTLRIFGGVAPSYNLSVRASEQSFANNKVYEADEESARDNLNALAANNLSRWQMDWQAGVGLRLGRRFEVGAFYKYSRSKSSKNTDADTNFLGNNSAVQPRSASDRHYLSLNGILFF